MGQEVQQAKLQREGEGGSPQSSPLRAVSGWEKGQKEGGRKRDWNSRVKADNDFAVHCF